LELNRPAQSKQTGNFMKITLDFIQLWTRMFPYKGSRHNRVKIYAKGLSLLQTDFSYHADLLHFPTLL
jgi:hypothetical protein